MSLLTFSCALNCSLSNTVYRRWYVEPIVQPSSPSSSEDNSSLPDVSAELDGADDLNEGWEEGVEVEVTGSGAADIQLAEAAVVDFTHAVGGMPAAPPDPSHVNLSADELFRNAVGASYWAGYWTALYQVCPY